MYDDYTKSEKCRMFLCNYGRPSYSFFTTHQKINLPPTHSLLSQPGVGANLNQQDPHGNSPLNYACAMGVDDEVVLRMLELGADPKIGNHMGAVALTHAVYSKMSDNVLKALVAHGSDPNYQNASGGTALQTACVCKSSVSTMRTLVELGADPKLANSHGYTPLIFALRNHNALDVCLFLCGLVGADGINCAIHEDPAHQGWTALHFAAHENLPGQAAVLAKHGADINIQNAAGQIPSELAKIENVRIAINSAYHHARDEQ